MHYFRNATSRTREAHACIRDVRMREATDPQCKAAKPFVRSSDREPGMSGFLVRLRDFEHDGQIATVRELVPRLSEQWRPQRFTMTQISTISSPSLSP